MTFKEHIVKLHHAGFLLHNIRRIQTELAAQLLAQALVICRLDYCNALLAKLPSCAIKSMTTLPWTQKGPLHTSLYGFPHCGNLFIIHRTNCGTIHLLLFSHLWNRVRFKYRTAFFRRPHPPGYKTLCKHTVSIVSTYFARMMNRDRWADTEVQHCQLSLETLNPPFRSFSRFTYTSTYVHYYDMHVSTCMQDTGFPPRPTW